MISEWWEAFKDWIRNLLSSDGAAAIAGYLVLPVVLVATGFFACIAFQSAPWIPVVLICVLASLLVPVILIRSAKSLGRRVQISRSNPGMGEREKRLVDELFGNYTAYVVEAAKELGELRDFSTVPALIIVLEQSVDTQRTCWREICESIIIALGQIGDTRALPALLKLRSVTGLRGMVSLADAITALEEAKQYADLLRPSEKEGVESTELLRAVTDTGATGLDTLVRPSPRRHRKS